MTTLDLLERAHAHLTELRASATLGPWMTIGDPGEGTWQVVNSENLHPVVMCWDSGDAETAKLIETLHRTIDAQLELLHSAYVYTFVNRGEELKNTSISDLARAILNEQ